MRPSSALFIIVTLCLVLQAVMHVQAGIQRQNQATSDQQMREVVKRLGLSDICVTTDARYIRHLALSDPVAPYMDHPGAIEHFPAGSFWVPVH
jgi:hypothetical protein